MQRTVAICLLVGLTLISVGSAKARSWDHPSPRMLVETADIAGVAISPDGESVAFRVERASTERDEYVSDWYVRDIAGRTPALRVADGGMPLKDGGVAIVETPQWSKDSRWIYFRALHDGDLQIWRASRDGSGSQQVTHDAANIRRFMLDPKDGTTLIYEVGASRGDVEAAERREYDQGVRIDGTVSGAQNLFRAYPIEGRLASARSIDGWWRELLSEAPIKRKEVNVATLEVADASPSRAISFERWAKVPEGSRRSVQSRDGMLVASLSGPYRAPEIAVTPADKHGQTVICAACRSLAIEDIAWRGNEEIVFTARDVSRGFAQRLYAWKPTDDTLREIARSDGLLSGDRSFGGSTCAVGDQYAACVAADPRSPPRLERIDLDTGSRSALFEPNSALARSLEASVRVEFLSWTAGGVPFTGHLILPASHQRGARLPLFVSYYICPGFLRGGFGDEWPLPSLADAGIAALCVNQGQKIQGDAAADFDMALSSIETIVTMLDQQGYVDRNRIGMGGLSFGAEVVNWVAAKSDLLCAASVANTAVSPTWYWFRSLLADWSDSAVAMNRWGLGSPDQTPEQWRRLSPVYFADQFEAPMLMQMPEGEYRAAIEQYVRMERAGAPVEMWVYPDETHQKQRPRVKLAAYQRNLDWFRYWLQDYVDPDPLKAEQFARWETLRARRDGTDGANICGTKRRADSPSVSP